MSDRFGRDLRSGSFAPDSSEAPLFEVESYLRYQGEQFSTRFDANTYILMTRALDRFDIDFSLCMFCGICVDVCPFEALFWTPEYEYSELKIADLLHDKTLLSQWMETVPDFEDYEAGSEAKKLTVPQ